MTFAKDGAADQLNGKKILVDKEVKCFYNTKRTSDDEKK